MNLETRSSDLPYEKRTLLSVLREVRELRRKGKQVTGLDAVIVNAYWYLWALPRTLAILFITRPLAIKGLPLWAWWCTGMALWLWKIDRLFLPSLKRSPLDQSLVRAVCRGEEHNVGIFLERGARPDQRLGRFLPLLPYVVQRGDLGIARLLLEGGANVEVRVIASGDTPLLRAVRQNDPAMVALLLAHGARVDVHGHIGVSPLIYAAGSGYTEVARLLLDHGADPEVRCPDGRTAMDYANNRGYREILALCEAYRKQSVAIDLQALQRPNWRRMGICCALSCLAVAYAAWRFLQGEALFGWLALYGLLGNVSGALLFARALRHARTRTRQEEIETGTEAQDAAALATAAQGDPVLSTEKPAKVYGASEGSAPATASVETE